MKRNKMMKSLVTFFCAILCFSMSGVPVLANSAQYYWEGRSQSGAIITGKDSPIIVEKELLTFDLKEFPKPYDYNEMQEFLAYSGKVTAEYTFYNPSEYEVTAKLLFPFGPEAEYADRFYDEKGNLLHNIDIDKYDIYVNGQPIEKSIRHTLSTYQQKFDLEEELKSIQSTFGEHVFYNPGMVVTRYAFHPQDIDLVQNPDAHIGFDVPRGNGDYRIYIPSSNEAKFYIQEDGELRISAKVGENGSEFEMYVYGTPLSAMPDFKIYKDGTVKDGDEISGRVEQGEKWKMTFQEHALFGWSEESGISRVDWYNAVLEEATRDTKYKAYPVVELPLFEERYKENLMRWYEYEITLKPGERIVNQVVAPVYPFINRKYEPDIYGYTYLLSPAKTWASFGELKIVVNTPYYISESSIKGFTKTETGYEVLLEGLPDGELTFRLSTSENPKIPTYNRRYTWIFVAIGIGGVVAFLIAIIATNTKKGHAI